MKINKGCYTGDFFEMKNLNTKKREKQVFLPRNLNYEQAHKVFGNLTPQVLEIFTPNGTIWFK